MAIGVVATYNGSYHSPGFELNVSGLSGFTTLKIERIDLSGEFPDTPVRGADNIPIIGTAFSVVDFEAPIGKNLVYRATGYTRDITDTFGRTVSNGWGVGSGKSWEIITSTPPVANFSVFSGVAQHSLTTVNVMRGSIYDVNPNSFDATFSIRPDAVAAGAEILGGLLSAFTDFSSYYRWDVSFQPSGSIDARLLRFLTGTGVTIATSPAGLTYTASSWWKVRCQSTEGIHRMKIWSSSLAEPSSWLFTVADSQVPRGKAGLFSILTAGNTNTLPVTVSYDDFTLKALGAATVAESSGTSSSVGIQDGFSRSASSGWGSPDLGLPWQIRSGLTTDYSAINGVGRIAMTSKSGSSAFGRDYIIASPITHSDIEQQVRFRVPATPAGDVMRVGMVARYTDINNTWAVELACSSTGTMQIRLGRYLNAVGVYSHFDDGPVIPGLTFTANTWYWIRFQLIGSAVRGKVWADGSSEPATWTLTFSDASIASGGFAGVKTFNSIFSSNPSPEVVEFDDYSLTILDNVSAIPYLDPGDVWLKSVGQPALSRRVNVSEWSENSRPGRVLGEYSVLGRQNKVVLTDVPAGREGTVALATFRVGGVWNSDSSLRDVESLLQNGGVLLLQTTGTDNTGEEDLYLAVTDISRTRVGVVGGDFAHVVKIGFIEVDRPATDQESLSLRSWQSVIDQNSTWLDVSNNHTSWLDALQRDL